MNNNTFVVLTSIIAILNLFLLLGAPIGIYIAIKTSAASTASTIQERVRQALNDENKLLQERLERVEKDNIRLNKLFLLVIQIFKKVYGADLEISGDMVILRDPTKGTHINSLDASNGTKEK